MVFQLKKYKLSLSILALLALTFILFFKSIFFDYAWDDVIILDNELIFNGLGNLKEIFIKKNSILLKDNFGYRPVTLLSFKIEFLLFGNSAKISHFFNIIIYLFILYFMIFVIKKFKKSKNLFYFLIGLAVFSFHPIHVEVVSNVKSRDELLGLFFSLLGIIFIIKGITKDKYRHIFFGLFWFLLAILSKEIEAILIIITSISLVYFFPEERKKTYLFSFFGFFIISHLFPYSIFYKFILFFGQFILIIVVDLLLNFKKFKQDFKKFVQFIRNTLSKEIVLVYVILLLFIFNYFLKQNNLLNYSILSVLILKNSEKNKWALLLVFIVVTFLMMSNDTNKIVLYLIIGVFPFLIKQSLKLKKYLGYYYFFLTLLFTLIAFFNKDTMALLCAAVFLSFIFLNLKKIKSSIIQLILLFLLSVGSVFIYATNWQFIHFFNTYPSIASNNIFRDIVIEDFILGNQFIHLNFVELIPNSFNVLLKYLENFYYPVNLKYYYGFNQIPLIGYNNPRMYLSIFIHLILIFLVFYYKRKDKLISFLALAYLISISIYSHFFIKLPDTMADRFFFIPSIFLSFLSVFLIQKLIYKISFPVKIKNYLFCFLSIISLMVLFNLSFQRQDVWQSNLSLFSSDIVKLKNCSRCHYNLALELSKEYELKKDLAAKDKIVFHFNRAIEIFPKAYNARLKLAIMHNMFGETQKTIVLLNELIALYEDKSEPYFEKGRILFENKNYLESFNSLDKAIKLFDNNPSYYYYQAWAAFNINSLENAIQITEFAKAKFPENYMFPDALSEFYNVQGERAKAIIVLENYLLKEPKNQTILNKLKQYK